MYVASRQASVVSSKGDSWRQAALTIWKFGAWNASEGEGNENRRVSDTMV